MNLPIELISMVTEYLPLYEQFDIYKQLNLKTPVKLYKKLPKKPFIEELSLTSFYCDCCSVKLSLREMFYGAGECVKCVYGLNDFTYYSTDFEES